MVDVLTTVPKVLGPFFVKDISLDTMELEAMDGAPPIPTYTFTIDVQDAGNNLYQLGIGITAATLRDTVLALQSAMATGFSGTSPRRI